MAFLALFDEHTRERSRPFREQEHSSSTGFATVGCGRRYYDANHSGVGGTGGGDRAARAVVTHTAAKISNANRKDKI